MNNLSLIILNYNSYSDTAKCINKLLSFQSNFKIILVDNCSTDSSYDLLVQEFSKREIDIIQTSHNSGYSGGNNFGIKYAINKYNSDYIGILNPDVIIPNLEILDKMMSSLNFDETYALIGASVIDDSNNYCQKSSAWSLPSNSELVLDHLLFYKNKKINSFKMISNNLAKVDCVVGCFFIMKSNILKEIGFFDDNVFLYNEENLLGFKLKEYGYKEIVRMDLFYYHNHKQKIKKKLTLKQKINTTYWSYKSRVYLCKQYYPNYLLFFLWIANKANKMYLFLAYIKNILMKGDAQ